MSNQMNDEKLWEMVGYVKVSVPRYQILKMLQKNFRMPTEIAKETGYRITLISNTLHDLKEKDLVFCKNENATKGRLYENTELALQILEIIDNNNKRS